MEAVGGWQTSTPNQSEEDERQEDSEVLLPRIPCASWFVNKGSHNNRNEGQELNNAPNEDETKPEG